MRTPSPTRRRSTSAPLIAELDDLCAARRLVHRRRGQALPTGSSRWPPGASDWAAPDEYERLAAAHRRPSRVQREGGRKGNWPRPATSRACAPRSAEAPRARTATSRRRSAEAHGAPAGVGDRAVHPARRPTSGAGAGQLEFHDLLVLARGLLRDPEHGWAVRRRLRERYTHLLLDEFQDTDPIQFDLAVLLASADPDAGASRPWTRSTVDPGGCSSSATRSSRSTASGGPTSPRSSRARAAFGGARGT